jgi:flagellum-specific peptidoglycan hydrolase FlgJ
MASPQQLMFLQVAKHAATQAGHRWPGCAAAEAAAETGWGADLPPGSNNFLGIKPPHDWKGKVVYSNGTEQRKDGSWTGPQHDAWCVFPTMADCFAQQMSILQTAKNLDGTLIYADALAATTPETYIAAECKHWSTSQAKTDTVLTIYHSHQDILG